MVRKVRGKIESFVSVPLVYVGWLAFATGIFIEGPIALKLMLLAAARVLP